LAAAWAAANGEQFEDHGTPTAPAAQQATEKQGPKDDGYQCMTDSGPHRTREQEHEEALQVQVRGAEEREGHDAEAACE